MSLCKPAAAYCSKITDIIWSFSYVLTIILMIAVWEKNCSYHIFVETGAQTFTDTLFWNSVSDRAVWLAGPILLFPWCWPASWGRWYPTETWLYRWLQWAGWEEGEWFVGECLTRLYLRINTAAFISLVPILSVSSSCRSPHSPFRQWPFIPLMGVTLASIAILVLVNWCIIDWFFFYLYLACEEGGM